MVRRTLTFALIVVLAALVLPARAQDPSSTPHRASAHRLFVALAPETEAGPSAVTRFDLDAEGRPRQGPTYATGGEARAYSSPQGMAVRPGGDLLFVANNASDDVTVFRILPDGTLDRSGEPFPVGGMPVYLAVHPTGEFLYVGNFTSGVIRVFHVADSGELTVVQDVAGGSPAEMEVDSGGDFLFVAAFSGIRVYSIASDGWLAEIGGSPFPAPGNRTLHLELDPAGERLFALDLDAGIAVYDVGPSGALHPVRGSPYSLSAFASTLALGGDGRFVYAGAPFQATLDAFRVLGQGRLDEIRGSPFPADYVAVEILNPAETSELYAVGAETRRIAVFEIGSRGALSDAPYPPVDVVDGMGRVPNGAACRRRPRIVP